MSTVIPSEQRLALIRSAVERLYVSLFVDLYDDAVPLEDAAAVVPFQIEGSGDGFGDEVDALFFGEDNAYPEGRDRDDYFDEFAFASLAELPGVILEFWDGVLRGEV